MCDFFIFCSKIQAGRQKLQKLKFWVSFCALETTKLQRLGSIEVRITIY